MSLLLKIIFTLSCYTFFIVSLQPFDFDPNEKKHKFMVQSIVAPDDGDFNMDTLVGINLLVFKYATLLMRITEKVYNLQMMYYHYFSKKVIFLSK